MILLTALFTISESVVTLAATRWFPAEPYVFSLSVLFISLILMRWGLFAIVPATVGAVAFCTVSGGEPCHYIIYIAGNLLAVIPFFYFRLRDKERVRKDPLKSAFLVFLVFLFQQTGRWLAGFAFGGTPGDIIRFLTTDSLSLLFALVAVTALRHADGLFEDQKSYLFRLERERKEQRNI